MPLLWVASGLAVGIVMLACLRSGFASTTSAFIFVILGGLIFLAIAGVARRRSRRSECESAEAQLLDLAGEAVSARDLEDVITYWNRGAETLYGWTRREAIGKSMHQLLRTVFPAPLEKIREALAHNDDWEGELLHTTCDGRRVAVASRWSLQRDRRGLPVGTLEASIDITERRAEEAQRRSQAAYLAETQKLSQTGSFGWNVSSGEIFWSAESLKIFSYAPAPKPTVDMMLDRVHPEDAALVRQVFERAASDKQDFRSEHRLLVPDGSVKYVHIVAHALSDQSGEITFVGAVMDVTVAKEARDRIQLIIDT
ncbi:MAG TPA: PAS domain-containing protein, partial [Stellaceae bacterium]|nr:PAS domain-containing protein [Stellaceae bacterium]